jgi:hypothetical protein
MPSTGPTTVAGPPSVIVQASLESEAFRIAAVTPARAVAGAKRGRAALRQEPQRRFVRYPSGQ